MATWWSFDDDTIVSNERGFRLFFKKSFRRLPRWSAVSALPASFPDGGRRGKWWIWMKILQSGSSFGVSFCFWFVSDVETLHFRPAKRSCRSNSMRKMNGNYFWKKNSKNRAPRWKNELLVSQVHPTIFQINFLIFSFNYERISWSSSLKNL